MGFEDKFFDSLGKKEEAEIAKAASYQEAAAMMYERLTPIQKRFNKDRASRKAILASRRTGKTFSAITELFIQCLRKTRSNCLYITLTRSSGKRIAWLLMQQFNQDFSLGIRFNNTDLIAYFKNGSMISIIGAGDRGEMEKLRGQSFDKAYIDECKSFHPDVLKELIYEVLDPAMLDYGGSVSMIGTPGAILSGPFYDVTCGDLGKKHRLYDHKDTYKGRWEFSVHVWKMWENEAMPEIWERAKELKERNGWHDTDPRWIREYLGEWVASDDALVYKYNRVEPGWNNWEPDRSASNKFGLPDGHRWSYLLGVDLGFEDPTAFVVAAYSTTHPNFYNVWSEKFKHLTVPAIAEKIEELQGIFGEFEVMVGDFGALGKTVGQTLVMHHGLNLIAAEKKEKFDHIELLNSDLLSGKCKILQNSDLSEEMAVLQWDHTGMKEHPGCANHCCDAFLYLWRHSYHYLREKVDVEVLYGSDAYWKEWDKREYEKACREHVFRQNNDKWGGLVIDEFGYDPELDDYGEY